MASKSDIKLTVPRVEDEPTNRVLAKIVEAVNTIMTENSEMKASIAQDAKRKHAIDSKLDTVGTIRIKRLEDHVYTLEIRTERGWKEAIVNGTNLRFE